MKMSINLTQYNEVLNVESFVTMQERDKATQKDDTSLSQNNFKL